MSELRSAKETNGKLSARPTAVSAVPTRNADFSAAKSGAAVYNGTEKPMKQDWYQIVKRADGKTVAVAQLLATDPASAFTKAVRFEPLKKLADCGQIQAVFAGKPDPTLALLR